MAGTKAQAALRLDNPITLLTDAHSADVAGQMLLLAVERFAAACERTPAGDGVA